MLKRDVKGHIVIYDEEAKLGVDYLDYHLDYQEAEVFFRAARERGKVNFEDSQNRNFTLKRNSNGTYTLIRRKSISLWPF